jgi:uncharacterized ferritin-like protein (DUF455 family)
MELREFATRILSADTLEEKLFTPAQLTDQEPGPPLFWKEPSRPAGMHFQKHTRKDKLPKLHEHHDPDKRAACLHRFAGHELLAVEIMAFALLAFPDAPKHFRRGVAQTLKEEQVHVRLYLKRMEEMGIRLTDLPLYRNFWNYTPFLKTPLQYLSVMSLTFEMANLDFAPMYGASFAKHGDTASAALMQQILKDELAHVSFGYSWLKKLKNKEVPEWDAWVESLPPRLTPDRAKGLSFVEENRIKIGISPEWISNLKNA